MAKKHNGVIYILFACLIISSMLSLCLGRFSISIPQIIVTILRPKNSDSMIYNILFNVRLPRVLASVLLGASLSSAGASYQCIFKNPMVSPSLLGVSSGAGFGAAIGIILDFTTVGIQIMAFCFGVLAVFAVYMIASRISKKMDHTLSLVLTGIVIGSLFTSLLSLLKYVGDPYNDLPAITFWMMGSVAGVTLKDVLIISIPVIIGISVLWLLKWRMNIMTFDEDEALSIGVETSKIRGVIILASTIITAAVVSISGMVSWIGLIVPHISRMIVGSDFRYSLPASVALGGIFMLILDSISRFVFTSEVPLGILTSLVGTPFFIYLMIRGKKSW